jgi:cysteine desulfurase
MDTKNLIKIYVDNNATTQLDKVVLEKMMPFLTEKFGNASSLHFFGQEARTAVENARKQLANTISANTNEVFFTSGGTESDNWIIKGIASANKKNGNHIITTAIEHHAVLDTCKLLGTQGFDITYLPVDAKGRVSVDDLKNAITDKTILVSVMFANNEVGTIQPIEKIGELLSLKNDDRIKNNLPKIYFHSDAVQALGKVKFSVADLKVDALSFSAHKIHGPKGIGGAYIKRGTKIATFMHGGFQENFRRAGTENTAGIVGFGEACEIISKDIEKNNLYLQNLRIKLYEGITKNIPDVYINGDLEDSLSNTLNLSFKFVEGEGIILLLNSKGIAVSSGSACTSGSLDTSHVLNAMAVDIVCAQGSIRFSLGKFNTESEIDYIIQVLPPIIKRLREMSPLL